MDFYQSEINIITNMPFLLFYKILFRNNLKEIKLGSHTLAETSHRKINEEYLFSAELAYLTSKDYKIYQMIP